jgi:hypothetical protein
LFGCELIQSKRFGELLNALRTRYDWIIALSSLSAKNEELEAWVPVFDHIAMAVDDQVKLADMEKYFPHASKISFLFI